MTPSAVTVQVDDREKLPLLFPATVRVWTGQKSRLVRVSVERVRLNCGDYRLKEAPRLCLVERKGSAEELYRNLMDPEDSRRQARAFSRLARGARYPYLLVETAASTLLCRTPRTPEPERFLQRLSRVLSQFGLHLMLLPQTSTSASRRVAGTLVIQLALGHLESDNGNSGSNEGGDVASVGVRVESLTCGADEPSTTATDGGRERSTAPTVPSP